jgi:hypothetical protein
MTIALQKSSNGIHAAAAINIRAYGAGRRNAKLQTEDRNAGASYHDLRFTIY